MTILRAIAFASILAALPARADIRIGDQTFPLAFEDSSLSAAERAAIETDVTAFWGSRTNAVFEPGVDGLLRGRIFDDAVYAAPYAVERIDVPSWVVLSGTNWSLRIPAAFSTAFRNAAATCGAHTNELAELDEFLDGLRPERLAVATTAELGGMVFRRPDAPAFTDADAVRLRGELGSFAYFRPSVLGIAETSGVSESADIALVALVPASARDSVPQDYSVARVGWNGFRWVLLSVL